MTYMSEEGLLVGRCNECGDQQDLHICPKCELGKCESCYGDRLNDGVDNVCRDCVGTYPELFGG